MWCNTPIENDVIQIQVRFGISSPRNVEDLHSVHSACRLRRSASTACEGSIATTCPAPAASSICTMRPVPLPISATRWSRSAATG